MDHDAMLPYLARAAKEARKARDRKQVHVAASLDRDQSTVARFEKAGGWPIDPDAMVAAYAEDLDISPLEIWRAALDLWASSGEQPASGDELPKTPLEPGTGQPKKRRAG